MFWVAIGSSKHSWGLVLLVGKGLASGFYASLHVRARVALPHFSWWCFGMATRGGDVMQVSIIDSIVYCLAVLLYRGAFWRCHFSVKFSRVFCEY